jgi:hypothetical protein
LEEECYRCGALPSSREHVPPKCLFPEFSDCGEHHRKDLITVPSCEVHNTAKSTDDEFLMVSLAGIIGNNSIGYMHKFGKVDRALRRRACKLLEKVLINRKTVERIEVGPNKFLEVLWGNPDSIRLSSAFEAIAYGLHLHHFKRRFVGAVRIYMGYLQYESGNSDVFNQFIRERAALDLEGKAELGSNPDVFSYQYSDKDQFGSYLARLKFYGGLDVYVAHVPEGISLPENPINFFIKAGIQTRVQLGDKAYVFNPD